MRSSCLYTAVLVAVIAGSSFGCKQRQEQDQSEVSDAEIAAEPEFFAGIEDHVDLEDLQQWRSYANKAERDPAVIKGMMEKAAKEFKVPAEILMAIGQVETNWTQIGPSIDRGWGVMHLVSNHYSDTLGEAAKLINSDPETLKNDINANIRGMAALLASKATPAMKSSKNIADWFPAVKAVTGLDGENLRNIRATEYFNVLKSGIKSRTIFDTYVEIAPVKNFKFTAPAVIEEEAAAEYPDGINDYIPCNFTAGRKVKVDTWTNHYIAVGSVAGARSWFKNCDAKASAHFLVARDGKVYQFRPSTDTTWHAGSKYNKNFPNNNHRSIGVEHEVLQTHPEYWQEEKLLNASVKLANFYISKYGIPKKHTKGDNNEPGIRGHQEMPGTATSCPGPLPWDKWFAKLGGGGGGSASTPAAKTGQLTGIVYRGTNKDDRIAGATVQVDATTIKTDKNGVYIFKDVVPGNYTIKITANGQTKSITRTAKAGETIWGSVSF